MTENKREWLGKPSMPQEADALCGYLNAQQQRIQAQSEELSKLDYELTATPQGMTVLDALYEERNTSEVKVTHLEGALRELETETKPRIELLETALGEAFDEAFVKYKADPAAFSWSKRVEELEGALREAEAKAAVTRRQLRWAWLNLGCRCIFDDADEKTHEDAHCAVHGVYTNKETFAEVHDALQQPKAGE